MKKILFISFVAGITILLLYGWNSNRSETDINKIVKSIPKWLQQGDIIFHTSTSNQSKAIQLATRSVYSHVGIIYETDGEYFVYEAIQPVKLTPLDDWIKRGEDSQYAVKRLKYNSLLTPENLNKMKSVGERFKNKNYDLYFEWSDDNIYCSELVWKIYKEALGIELGALQELKDFDLSSDIVKKKMKERYGNTIPLHEKVISPAAIFESDKLTTIKKMGIIRRETEIEHYQSLCDKFPFEKYKTTEASAAKKGILDTQSLKSLPPEIIHGIKYQYNEIQAPNFAGQYVLISWGCGSPCQMNAIINFRTGKIEETFNTSFGVDFKENSNLLIFNPPNSAAFNDDYRHTFGEPEFYIWQENKLKKLKS